MKTSEATVIPGLHERRDTVGFLQGLVLIYILNYPFYIYSGLDNPTAMKSSVTSCEAPLSVHVGPIKISDSCLPPTMKRHKCCGTYSE